MAQLDCQSLKSDCKPMLHPEILTPRASRSRSPSGPPLLSRVLTKPYQIGDEPDDLPGAFPNVERPRFLEGDHLRWIAQGELTDWGIAIGRFYSFAHHHRCWTWCYLIWLDADSPSAAWVKVDIAWEADLELLEVETPR
jgi:hypothetical protein